MDLSGSWNYIEKMARSRLANNKTERHVSEYGEGIEVMGVAGEILARRCLGLNETVHKHFDGGYDFTFAGKKIDVKATHLTPRVSCRFLQWPLRKRIKADVILMTAVDMVMKQGIVLGWVTEAEMMRSPINRSRAEPCHEVPVPDLHPVYELIALHLQLRTRL